MLPFLYYFRSFRNLSLGHPIHLDQVKTGCWFSLMQVHVFIWKLNLMSGYVVFDKIEANASSWWRIFLINNQDISFVLLAHILLCLFAEPCIPLWPIVTLSHLEDLTIFLEILTVFFYHQLGVGFFSFSFLANMANKHTSSYYSAFICHPL